MALTKISTGGFKDDAASQAKIADEAVDEARLQVSNAGTDGQFLQKQSGDTGGLTWATVTVPDSDKIEEGNTSIETVDTGSDGHVKITNEGTESARFSSDGALLIGTTSGTHRLTVQGGGTEIAKFIGTNSADLRFRNSTSNHLLVYTGTGDSLLIGTDGQNERFRIDNEGKLGIGGANYGSSGQVLTSQGTGGAPQWADAGGWTTLTSGTTTSGNSKEITTTHLTSSYQLYRLTFDIRGSLSIEDICYIQQYSNGAWQTSNYRWRRVRNGDYHDGTTETGIYLGYPNKRWQGTLTFAEPNATDTATFYEYYGSANNDNGGSTGNGGIKEQLVVTGCGGINDNTATTGLRFKLNGGSNAFTRGWYILEGLAIS